MDPWNIGNNGNLCNFKKSDTNLVNYGILVILVILVTFGKNQEKVIFSDGPWNNSNIGYIGNFYKNQRNVKNSKLLRGSLEYW